MIEFVSGGSLDKLLEASHVQPESPDPPYTNIWSKLTERELLSIASDVANGMKHLESKQVNRIVVFVNVCSILKRLASLPWQSHLKKNN